MFFLKARIMLPLLIVSVWSLAPINCSVSALSVQVETVQGQVIISSHSRSFVQGETVMLRLQAPPFKSAVAGFNDRSRPFAPLGGTGTFFTLIPLGLTMDEGDYELFIEVLFTDETRLSIPLKIALSKGAFPSVELSVASRFTSPSPEELRRIERERLLLAEIYENPRPGWLGDGNFDMPLEGGVSSPYGVKRLFNGAIHSRHRGIDIRGSQGTAVRAANAGIVVFARSLFFAGETVIIDHGMGLFTQYCHLSTITVAEGTAIPKGAEVGRVGATGRVTGPHLHWGVRLADLYVDPLSILSLSFQ